MRKLQFRGDPTRVAWSQDSPEQGTLECVCSYCGRSILAQEPIALRVWCEQNGVTYEARFCDPCAAECFGLIADVLPLPVSLLRH